MMASSLCGISGWPWQRVLHMSIFLLYHLHRLVLWSLHIIPTHFLESYTWNVGNCPIGHHRRWWFQVSGAGSFLFHSHQMASASSQALPTEEFVCGTPRQERRRQAHLLDILIRSGPWLSRQMASTTSQARPMKQFVCGMPLRERRRQAHLMDTRLRSE